MGTSLWHGKSQLWGLSTATSGHKGKSRLVMPQVSSACLSRPVVSHSAIPRPVAHQAPVYGDSPGKNTGVGCHALLQGIFPTQGLNPGLLPHCRRIPHPLSHQGSPVSVE